MLFRSADQNPFFSILGVRYLNWKNKFFQNFLFGDAFLKKKEDFYKFLQSLWFFEKWNRCRACAAGAWTDLPIFFNWTAMCPFRKSQEMRITPPYWAWLFCSVISNNSFLLSRKSIIQSDWYHGDSGQLVEHLGGGHQDDRARADHCYVQIKAIVRENQVFSRNK